jgi:hypothetical protein
MARHVAHLALVVIFQPVRETLLGLAQIDVADADLLETEFVAPTANIIRQVLLVRFIFLNDFVQKLVPSDLSV